MYIRYLKTELLQGQTVTGVPDLPIESSPRYTIWPKVCDYHIHMYFFSTSHSNTIDVDMEVGPHLVL